MLLTCEDKIEIQELTARYANAMDSENLEGWLETWSDDGIWQGGLGTYKGKSELRKLLDDLGARIKGKRHVMTNSVIDSAGDTAVQHCYLCVFERVTEPRLIATAVYNDVLTKASGAWKFARRTVTLDPSFAPSPQL